MIYEAKSQFLLDKSFWKKYFQFHEMNFMIVSKDGFKIIYIFCKNQSQPPWKFTALASLIEISNIYPSYIIIQLAWLIKINSFHDINWFNYLGASPSSPKPSKTESGRFGKISSQGGLQAAPSDIERSRLTSHCWKYRFLIKKN